MSALESSEILETVKQTLDINSTQEPSSSAESKYSGLRDLAKQKESWSRWLRGVLIVSFVVQIGVLAAVVFGREVDVWAVRGIILQFTAMFIAALRYLFK